MRPFYSTIILSFSLVPEGLCYLFLGLEVHFDAIK